MDVKRVTNRVISRAVVICKRCSIAGSLTIILNHSTTPIKGLQSVTLEEGVLIPHGVKCYGDVNKVYASIMRNTRPKHKTN